MVERRAFLCGTVAMLSVPFVAGAQQVIKVSRIGFLSFVGSRGAFHQVFEQTLSERGWVPGKPSSSSIALPRRSTIGSLPSRPNWFDSSPK
jgi:hypothetical protein